MSFDIEPFGGREVSLGFDCPMTFAFGETFWDWHMRGFPRTSLESEISQGLSGQILAHLVQSVRHRWWLQRAVSCLGNTFCELTEAAPSMSRTEELLPEQFIPESQRYIAVSAWFSAMRG